MLDELIRLAEIATRNPDGTFKPFEPYDPPEGILETGNEFLRAVVAKLVGA